MASCSLGASNFKLSRLDISHARVCNLEQQNGIKTWMDRRPLKHTGLALSHESRKAFTACCGAYLETDSGMKKADSLKDTKSSVLVSQLTPNSSEIEFLVTEICNTTIAEFELKLGGFRLYVMRNLTEKTIPPTLLPPPAAPAVVPASALAPVSEKPTIDAPVSNASVPSKSFAITKSVSSAGGIQSFINKASDEGLMLLQSPRVGFFRRSRTIKGKRAPPPCKEKQMVKEGQVLCYIEQLGGEIPIESDVSGEVIKILREDGEPVGYGDALIAILPSFPGINKI